jgi:hypothetical protein
MREVTSGQTKSILVILLLAASIQFLSPVAADVMVLEDISAGGCFGLNATVSMPLAEVNVSIDAYGSVAFNSTFRLESPSEEGFRVAFLFPTYDWQPVTRDEGGLELEILVDSKEVGYDLVNGSSINMTDLTLYIPTHELMFAIFNVSFLDGDVRVIETFVRFTPNWFGNAINIRYYVGSASTWAGDTHETVDMEIRGYSQFVDHSFYPEDYFTATYDGANARGIWDFNASEFDSDWTSFGATLRVKTNLPPALLLYVVSGVALVMVAIVLFHFRRK